MIGDGKHKELANELSIFAVRLIRWLRAADATPALSGPEASALAVVIYAGEITPSALAELEQVRRPTIARVLDALEARGLIRREPHGTDRRSVTIVATEAGMTLWQAGQSRRAEPLVAALSTLSADDRARLREALPILQRLLKTPMSPPIDAKVGTKEKIR